MTGVPIPQHSSFDMQSPPHRGKILMSKSTKSPNPCLPSECVIVWAHASIPSVCFLAVPRRDAAPLCSHMAADTISARPALSNNSHPTPLVGEIALAWPSAPRCPSLLLAADTISARSALSNNSHSTPLERDKASVGGVLRAQMPELAHAADTISAL